MFEFRRNPKPRLPIQTLDKDYRIGKPPALPRFDKHTYQPDGPDANTLRCQSSAPIIQQRKSDVNFLSQNNGFGLSSPEVLLKQCHHLSPDCSAAAPRRTAGSSENSPPAQAPTSRSHTTSPAPSVLPGLGRSVLSDFSKFFSTRCAGFFSDLLPVPLKSLPSKG